MADTAINEAPSRRFHNGGTLRITVSATDYAIGQIRPGGVSVNRGGRAKAPEFDGNGNLTGNMRPGNERPSRVDVTLDATKGGLTGTSDLLDLVRETVDSATGNLTTFPIIIEELDSEGGATGYRGTITNACLDTESFAIGGGETDADTLSLSFIAADKDVSWATFI